VCEQVNVLSFKGQAKEKTKIGTVYVAASYSFYGSETYIKNKNASNK